MKKILFALLLVSAGYLVFVMSLSPPTCDEQVTYRIGTVDPRFELDEEELHTLLDRAENIWEKSTGKNLLAYDAESMLAVDFVFDERQIRTLESKKLDSKLETLEDAQAKIEKEFGTVSTLYDAKATEYERSLAAYEARLADYNKRVDYWNARGGAPEKEYNKLEDDAKDLEKFAASIEKNRLRLNEYADQTGTLAEKDNRLVESYNEEVASFEQTYGEGREFDQGLYTGDKITIYQFEGGNDLVLALAHEFGHSLGIGHVEDPEALMYPLLEKQNVEAPALQPADTSALATACDERQNPFVRVYKKFLLKA